MNKPIVNALAVAVFLLTISLGDSIEITISFEDTTDSEKISSFYQCEADTGFIAVCSVVGSVGAAPIINVTASDGSVPTFVGSTTPSGIHESKYKVIPKQAGNLSVTCSASVPGSPGNAVTKTETITVYAGLTKGFGILATSNTESIYGIDKIKVEDGETLRVSCRAESVDRSNFTELTLSCLGHNSSSLGGSPTLTLVVNKEDGREGCVCDSGCVSKTAELQIDVIYPPKMIEFEGNSQSDNVTLSLGDSVTFMCKVIANPVPKSLMVTGQRSGERFQLNEVTVFTETSFVTELEGRNIIPKNITHYSDTGAYTCTADNGMGEAVNKTFYVLAKFSPQFQSSFDGNHKKFVVKSVSEPLKVKIPIIGYPTPTSYNLTLYQDHGRKSVVVTDFKASYASDTNLPDQGTVFLSLNVTKAKEDDVNRYVFEIQNGVSQNGLHYAFMVDTPQDSDSESGLSTGAKAGIGIGVIVGVLVLCVAGFLLYKRGK